jgi:hypothetical protein
VDPPSSLSSLGSKLLVKAKAFSVDKVIIPLSIAPTSATSATLAIQSTESLARDGTVMGKGKLAGSSADDKAEPGFWVKTAFEAVMKALNGLHTGTTPA